MKKTFKILLFILSIFTFINIVCAEEEFKCEDLKNSAAVSACKHIEEACYSEDSDLKGCVYNKDSTVFSRASSFDCYGFNCVSIKDVPLTRGYMAVDKNGRVYFAGCYKANYAGNRSDNNKTKRFGPGTYFIFKIIPPSGTICDFRNQVIDTVPPADIDGYDGSNSMGTDHATYKWNSKTGECPIYFGLTANTTGWTSDKNKYVFADNEGDLQTDKKQFRLLFWNSEYYVTNPGCTVEDEAGMREAVKCYDDAINEIVATKCPEDISNYDAFKAQIEGLGKKCDNKFMKLYSIDLLKRDAEIFKQKLNEAVTAKLTSCQFGNCNLTASEQEQVNSAIAQSKYPNGCASLTGTEYDACYLALSTIYNNIFKTQPTKAQCLIDSQKKRDQAQQQLEEIVEQEQEQHIQEELQETREIRTGIISGYIPQLPDMPEVPGPTTCSNLLGTNLVKVVKAAIRIIQIVGAIIAIVKGMMILIPPILSKDSDALKKASSTLVTMAIILVIIFLFPTILRVIGSILGFDLSCI